LSGRRDPRDRKAEPLEALARLLDVAGCETPWEEIERELRGQISVSVLRALEYRVRQARSDAFDEGETRRSSA